MALFVRTLLALLMVATLLGTANAAASAGLIAEMSAAGPCCEGDCPDHPSCDPACVVLARCAAAFAALLPSAATRIAPKSAVAKPPPVDELPPSGFLPDGLKRPPRL